MRCFWISGVFREPFFFFRRDFALTENRPRQERTPKGLQKDSKRAKPTKKLQCSFFLLQCSFPFFPRSPPRCGRRAARWAPRRGRSRKSRPTGWLLSCVVLFSFVCLCCVVCVFVCFFVCFFVCLLLCVFLCLFVCLFVCRFSCKGGVAPRRQGSHGEGGKSMWFQVAGAKT